MGRGLDSSPLNFKKNKQHDLKNNNNKHKLECNRKLLSTRIYTATSATENNNTGVRSVNIGHFDINFDISFDNGSVDDV